MASTIQVRGDYVKLVIMDMWIPLQIPSKGMVLEPGGINRSESSRNNQSELIRNSQCTCLADRLPTVIQRDR